MTRLRDQFVTISALDITRATQYLDLLWAHNVHMDMSYAHDSYEEDRKEMSSLVGKPVKISLSIEEII